MSRAAVACIAARARARAWQLGSLVARGSCEGEGARQIRRVAVAHRLMVERHDLGNEADGHVLLPAHGQLVVASSMLKICEAKEE